MPPAPFVILTVAPLCSMFYLCEPLSLETHQPIEIIDVTAVVRARVEQTGARYGHVTLFSPHTTAFVCLNEREEMLQRDMLAFLERVVPADPTLLHNLAPVDGRLNAHSHLLGLFMNASETIPIHEGVLMLGGWQSVFFVELDGPRNERCLQLQICGER
jgi:secondary thiamine-phosphate synthase enzyme